MPPMFEKRNFDFEKGQRVLKHIERSPLGRDRDRSKFAVLTELVGANHFFVSAIDINSRRSAQLLADRRKTADGIGNTYTSYVLPPWPES